MSTPAAPSTSRSNRRAKGTSERRVASLFGLKGDSWMRHANPWSVWTRFAVLPLLVLAVWSRDWIGWWSLAGVALLAYGLIELDLLIVVAGLVLTQTAKAWYIDRMVLLYEDMKARSPEYAAWER
jgi:hypothetical protein